MVIPDISDHSKRTKIAKKCLVKWARKLKQSGYPVTFQHQVIIAAIGRCRRLVQDEVDGVRPIHRWDWRRNEMKLAKGSKGQIGTIKPKARFRPLRF